MKYKENIVKATFVKRHNRFVAQVILNDKTVFCHVKNTGRCKEIFLPGAKVYLAESDSTTRKYKYSLIAVEKKGMLINVDSQAPNKVAGEYLAEKYDFDYIKPEVTYGRSRFDFYAEKAGKKYYIEVKGVTLEKEGVASFPDAPTVRGLKHVNELICAKHDGYECMLLFIVQMKGIEYFEPNDINDPDFSAALRKADKEGVKIHAVDCVVAPEFLYADKEVKIKL